MNWNPKTGEWEGETDEYFVTVDSDEMAECRAKAEAEGYDPDQMPEFSVSGWVDIGLAGNDRVMVTRKHDYASRGAVDRLGWEQKHILGNVRRDNQGNIL